jgi:2',3'-cyclic-nucleotide 2'-phosphodiesterase
LNILFIGDIVGSSGRNIIKDRLSKIRDEQKIDVAIANAENAASGLGITSNVAEYLFSSGLDILTLGNHTWSKNEFIHSIEQEDRIIRPANVTDKWPGKGYAQFEFPTGDVLVINLLGRVGMMPYANCPFETADAILENIKQRYDTKVILVDFHAEATSEKQALARYLDGRISLLVGTHTHVQTADEKILRKGTGFITDVGMTGPVESVIGMDSSSSIKRFLTKMPVPYLVASGPGMLSGIVANIDTQTGKTKEIKRILIQ